MDTVWRLIIDNKQVLEEIGFNFAFLCDRGFNYQQDENSVSYIQRDIHLDFYYECRSNELYGKYGYGKHQYNLFLLLSFLNTEELRLLSIFPTTKNYLIEMLSYYSDLLKRQIDNLLTNNDVLRQATLSYKEYLNTVSNQENDLQCDVQIANSIKEKNYPKALYFLNRKVHKTERDYKREEILKKLINPN